MRVLDLRFYSITSFLPLFLCLSVSMQRQQPVARTPNQCSPRQTLASTSTRMAHKSVKAPPPASASQTRQYAYLVLLRHLVLDVLVLFLQLVVPLLGGHANGGRSAGGWVHVHQTARTCKLALQPLEHAVAGLWVDAGHRGEPLRLVGVKKTTQSLTHTITPKPVLIQDSTGDMHRKICTTSTHTINTPGGKTRATISEPNLLVNCPLKLLWFSYHNKHYKR